MIKSLERDLVMTDRLQVIYEKYGKSKTQQQVDIMGKEIRNLKIQENCQSKIESLELKYAVLQNKKFRP